MPRLILFDIDGTLMASSGAGMRSMARALREVAGLDPLELGVRPDGQTDPLIVRETFRLGKYPSEQWTRAEEEVWLRYPAYLQEELASPELAVRALPGVDPLLRELAGHEELCLGLLTGNLEVTARIKLARVELNDFFPIGAFGSDCADRNRLGMVALERARRHYSAEFEPRETWIVGDTDRDVAAARALGGRALAVATGRYSQAELEEHLPDSVLADLSEVERVTRLLLS